MDGRSWSSWDGGVVIAWWVPPVPQDPAYHRFADARAPAGRNGANVLSNAAFLLADGIGLHRVLSRGAQCSWTVGSAGRGRCSSRPLPSPALGSAWYHLAPDNTRLVCRPAAHDGGLHRASSPP